jgi:hypothetical protein
MVTLIGDVIGSREFSDSADRAQLQRALEQTLVRANQLLAPVQPLEPTVGDEFQGGFADVATAVRATLIVRIELLDGVGADKLEGVGADSRYGLGHGPVTVFEKTRSPVSQDGPGWWAARGAIDRAKELSESPRTAFARTCFDGTGGEPLDAFLLCRDGIVNQMSARGRRLLLGLLLGRPQWELADEEGITQSAVSQSLARSGAFAIEAAQLRLEQGPA